MSFDGGDKSSLWSKIVGNAAKSVLAIYRMTSNIHSSFNPHLLVYTNIFGMIDHQAEK